MHYFTNDQKTHVAKLARAAYESWEGREQWEESNGEFSRTKCFEIWRHAETAKVTGGIASLRDCVSEVHYLPLVAHFNDLAGKGGAALRALLRHQEERRITPFFKLQQALAERGLDEAYAAAICRRQYKCELGDASEKQLWSLVFTIRNRRKVAQVKERKPAPRRIAASLGTLSVSTRDLEQGMAEAVRDERYEDAARLRDLIAPF